MNASANIEPLEKSLVERIATARRFRQQFKFTGDEEFLMNIIEELLQREADSLNVLDAWSNAHWLAGISAVENSNDPIEALLFRTRAALAKAKGGAA